MHPHYSHAYQALANQQGEQYHPHAELDCETDLRMWASPIPSAKADNHIVYLISHKADC